MVVVLPKWYRKHGPCERDVNDFLFELCAGSRRLEKIGEEQEKQEREQEQEKIRLQEERAEEKALCDEINEIL